ncbi:hypothetical protein BH10PSE7_BH10PSE7_30620 [soil metagenome]
MPISINRAKHHVETWTKNLAPYSTRANWPSYLFHTCQLEVAVAIIKARKVECREDVPNLICDVANQGALWNNPNAHHYVRLYFRPRNSFHLKTEGVKSRGDPYRVDPHMSVPIAFAFDFEKVITRPDSGFVPGNFARNLASPQTGDEYFDQLDFGLIYHDSAPSRDRMSEIHNWRMSEVVVQKSLSLHDNLACIICRTTHEERTLRYALGNTHPPKKIIVEQRVSTFFRRGIFIDEIYWHANEMHMRFHGPVDCVKDTYEVGLVCMDNSVSRRKQYDLKPGKYRFPDLSASPNALWRVNIEGCILYEAPIPSAAGLVGG